MEDLEQMAKVDDLVERSAISIRPDKNCLKPVLVHHCWMRRLFYKAGSLIKSMNIVIVWKQENQQVNNNFNNFCASLEFGQRFLAVQFPALRNLSHLIVLFPCWLTLMSNLLHWRESAIEKPKTRPHLLHGGKMCSPIWRRSFITRVPMCTSTECVKRGEQQKEKLPITTHLYI